MKPNKIQLVFDGTIDRQALAEMVIAAAANLGTHPLERVKLTLTVQAATNEEVEIVDAYKKTYDMILDAFAELNVTKVDTVGVEFDYEMHQAILQMPSDEYEEGIVCQEFAMGWKCGEKLIRPAMVAVTA